jgi:hypothetical protein
MDFLSNTNDDNLDNNSSDYSDEEFEYIDYDTIDFEKPFKNKDNIYLSNLDEKIILELDNLEIFEVIEEDNRKFVIFNLDLDNEDHNELIEILYNLDEKALEKCLEYSSEWFNKEMSEQDVENLYVPLYIDNYKQKGHVLMKVLLDKDVSISDLHISNINIIEIKGLIFYKKTFLYNIVLKDILQDNINLIDNISHTSKQEEDTSELTTTIHTPELATATDISEVTIEVDTPSMLTESISLDIQQTLTTLETNESIELPSETLDNKPQKKTIEPELSELSNTQITVETNDIANDSNAQEDHSKDISLNKKIKTVKKKVEKKYQELLERKRLEVKENFMRSEKINQEAEQIRIKAIESANELRKIEQNLNTNQEVNTT